MKKLPYIIMATLFMLACNKTENNEMSDCIAIKVEKFKTESRLQGFSSVAEYNLDNELYYFFDYGAAADWGAYILDNQCDTVCVLGFKKANLPCKIDDFFSKAIKVKVLVE